MTTERDIEARLVKRVRELGGEVRKVKWIGRRGAPDRLVMLPARRWEKSVPGYNDFTTHTRAAATIWVELKAPGVKPEPHQIREHERMRHMGQRVVVIDSFKSIEEVLK